MEKSCPLMINFDKGTPSLANEIKLALEGNDDLAKTDAMKKAIMLLINGETLPQLFISIVRYVLPSEDHTIQKLLLLYLEIIDKTDSTGRVLPEMILICQNLRNNLQHPNEYLRGVTLRFLCRLSETEIIEPLIPSILSNLEHRHPYVRSRAILAVMCICKLPHGDQLLADAPEVIERIFTSEVDSSARCNAFFMLFSCAQDRAVKYLLSHADQVQDWPARLQMDVLDLIHKVCRSNRAEKGRYIKIIISLLNAPSTAVIYECAVTLVSLSSAPTAIRAAANTYCQLLSQSDNNVKLIVLERLNELKASHWDIMVEMIMDILRSLSSPNLDIRRKTLDITLELITPRNVDEVVLMLKKEVVKTQSGELEKNGEYRQMLVQAIHTCAMKFPEVASTVVHLLMDFLGDGNVASAVDVALFVREIIETNPKLRVSIITRLLDTFYQIRAARVCSCALWIIGEYCISISEVENGISTIKQCLGELPFYTTIEESENVDATKPLQINSSVTVSSRRPAILTDGTYATQSAALENVFSAPVVAPSSLAALGNLRSLILSGDFFLGAVISSTLTKLILRLEEVQPSKTELNKACAGTLLIMVSILQLGQSAYIPHPIDNDSYERITLCIKLLCNPNDKARTIWLQSCRQSFANMLADKHSNEAKEIKAKTQISHAQPDDLIDFYHLKSRKGISQLELEDEVQDDLKHATGEFTMDSDDVNKLNRILQLTGFSDPVYAEAFVTVHHYDIVLEVTVINRTKDTLQNLCLELATMGDLKLVERPQNYTLAPESCKQIRANIKVSSTETGVIFGNIVYETSNVLERTVVVLNDIHIDIMDYISPANCADVSFRNMWAEFEWENKLGQSAYIPHPIDNDSYERITLCIKLLCNPNDKARTIWLQSCRQSFANMLVDKHSNEAKEIKAKTQISHAQPDDLIDFYHLKSRKGISQLELEDEVQDDLKHATGEFTMDSDDVNKLNRILQLTGFSDPVYAEAFVTVHHYDIVLEVTVINRTKDTLQNLCLELATMGDLKLVERPQNYTLAPESCKQIRANIKVSSTETGVIFGNIVYETSNVLERTVVVLNDIHIDIMDYISPANCADVSFRNMWAEFEWENKVAVNTVIQDEKEFLDHIMKSTNMKCLTAPSALSGESGFLAANLYAKSVFGEDALVNISVEKQADGKLSGYIRIRSKTQGIALSLGDKITLKQKGGS